MEGGDAAPGGNDKRNTAFSVANPPRIGQPLALEIARERRPLRLPVGSYSQSNRFISPYWAASSLSWAALEGSLPSALELEPLELLIIFSSPMWIRPQKSGAGYRYRSAFVAEREDFSCIDRKITAS